jgi:hypothetical protein
VHTITTIPIMTRHTRRRAGIPKKTSSATIAVPPVLAQPLTCGLANEAEVAAVVLTVAVAVPLLADVVRVTGEPVIVQLGAFVAPAGELVSAQLNVTEPLYPLVPVTVIVEVAELPFAMAAGFVAAIV